MISIIRTSYVCMYVCLYLQHSVVRKLPVGVIVVQTAPDAVDMSRESHQTNGDDDGDDDVGDVDDDDDAGSVTRR